MTPPDDKLPSIDADALDSVTGGVASSANDSQLAAALQSIQSSLSSLGQARNNNSGNALTQMLPLLLFARGGAGGGGACPCGCGMANCRR